MTAIFVSSRREDACSNSSVRPCQKETSKYALQPVTCSIREVEVVISVVVIFALAEAREDEVERAWEPCDAEPDSESEVANPSLDDETLEATIHEVEEPLLSGVGTMMEDHAASKGSLLVEVLLTIPRSPSLLWNTETLTVCESHVFGVSVVVGLEASSCSHKVPVRNVATNAPCSSLARQLLTLNVHGWFKHCLILIIITSTPHI